MQQKQQSKELPDIINKIIYHAPTWNTKAGWLRIRKPEARKNIVILEKYLNENPQQATLLLEKTYPLFDALERKYGHPNTPLEYHLGMVTNTIVKANPDDALKFVKKNTDQKVESSERAYRPRILELVFKANADLVTEDDFKLAYAFAFDCDSFVNMHGLYSAYAAAYTRPDLARNMVDKIQKTSENGANALNEFAKSFQKYNRTAWASDHSCNNVLWANIITKTAMLEANSKNLSKKENKNLSEFWQNYVSDDPPSIKWSWPIAQNAKNAFSKAGINL